jgi:S-adenosyl methyltransferase
MVPEQGDGTPRRALGRRHRRRKRTAVTADGTPAVASEPADSVSSHERPGSDPSVAHIARVYDYWLGGKDNFAADMNPSR